MVIEVTERYDREGSFNSKFEKVYRRRFWVITDDRYDGPVTVAQGVGIAIGTPYDLSETESDPNAFMRNMTVRCVAEDGKQWEAELEYGAWEAREENPLDEPPDLSYDYAQFEEVADKTEDDPPVAILNTAGDYFDPPVTRDQSRPIFTVVRNEPTFNAELADDMKDSTNLSMFLGRPAGTVKCTSITGKSAYHPVCGLYFVVTYVFHVNPAGWKKVILNQGLRCLDSNGDRSQIVIGGQLATSPVLLDADGAVLPPTGEPVWLEFMVYKVRDFAIFNLEPTPPE